MSDGPWGSDETTLRIGLVIVILLAVFGAMWLYAADHGLDVLLPVGGP